MDAFLKYITQSKRLFFTLTACAVFVAYAFMLHAPFRSMDDSVTIVGNQDIRSFENIPKIFTSSFFGDRSYYRPLVSFSYMIEYHFFGLNSFFYNLDNVLLHILNAFGVYFLIFRLMRDKFLAYGVSFLFAIHPIHWEAVSNISGRVILLNTFFLLIAFCLFIDFRKRREILYLVGSLISFVLALLCKESAAVFPAVLLMYLAFFDETGTERSSKPWLSVLNFILIVVGMIIFRRQLMITELFTWNSFGGMFLGFGTFASGVLTYLRLFVLPVDLYFDRSKMLYQSFLDPQLVVTVVLWILILALLWKYRAKIDRAVFFFLFWFAFELAPVSQIVTSLGVQPGFISLAEHFLYVPSIAVLTVGLIALRRLTASPDARRWFSPAVRKIVAVAFISFLFLTTVQQNIYAGQEMAMLTHSIERQPINSRVLYSLGMVHARRGMFPEAEQYFRRAVIIDPWNIRAQIALGKSLCDQGKYDEGITVYETISNPVNQKELLAENLRLSYALREQQKTSRRE